MNLNQRIAPLTGGIPKYTNKINEMIASLNWLFGMRTDAGPISGGGRGPIISTGAAPAILGTGPQPWLKDPEGNAAGWGLITSPDINNLDLPTTWTWRGPAIGNYGGGWLKDPGGVESVWVGPVGVVFNQQPYDCWFWGTASQSQQPIPGQCGTAYTIHFVANSFTPTKNIQTFTGTGINAVWPYLCTPSILFQAFANAIPNPSTAGPFFSLNGYGGAPSDVTISWVHTIEYDGFTVVQSTGSSLVHAAPGPVVFSLNEPSMNWTYDSSIPGYVAVYEGVPSSNPNPVVTETLEISQPLFSLPSSPGGIEPQYFGVQFLTYFSNT